MHADRGRRPPRRRRRPLRDGRRRDRRPPPRFDGAADGARRANPDAALPDGGIKTEAGCGPLDATANCTGCGLACNATHSLGPSCNGTTCLYTGCAAGYADCIKTAPDLNGCETPTNTVTNCSGCGITCDTTESAGASCNGTTCLYTSCAAGWGDCDTTAPDSDGCETQLNTVTNCSACGSSCNPDHATGVTCNGATCKYASCAAGYADCNAATAPDTDGCETPTNTVTNCSGCGDACDTKHSAGAACTGSTCTYTSCSSGYADCNKTAPDTDGCETQLNTTSDCTGCGLTCDTANSLGASCSGTSCEYTGCKPDYADCDTTPPDLDGCETYTGSSTASCGACGQSCDTTHSTGASCVDGTCVYTGCEPGYADCVTTPPDTNGCETQIDTVTNCGACGAACDTSRSKGAACTGGGCTYTGCDPGYADCDTTAPDTNGCETSLSSTSDCGGCGNVCPTANSSPTTCNGTQCSYTCEAGFADCTTGDSPDLGGCATSTTSTSNCGGCGNACKPVGAASDTCNGLSCSYTCNTGRYDCNMNTPPDTDGCECTGSGTGCCGASCQTAHSNGTGQSYYDCNPLKTYTSITAVEACLAYSAAIGGTSANCSDGFECTGSGHPPVVSPTFVCYQNSAGTTCIGPCWAYSSTANSETGNDDLQGDVLSCSCPAASTGATWD